MKSKMAIQREMKGYTAFQFAEILRKAGLKSLTESRLYRIEQGRTKPNDIEREIISQVLGIPLWELNI